MSDVNGAGKVACQIGAGLADELGPGTGIQSVIGRLIWILKVRASG